VCSGPTWRASGVPHAVENRHAYAVLNRECACPYSASDLLLRGSSVRKNGPAAGALRKRCAARTPLVVTSVHAFIWPFSRAERRPSSARALYAPQAPVNHIDSARSSGFPVRSVAET
jgi:hypothetical protein